MAKTKKQYSRPMQKVSELDVLRQKVTHLREERERQWGHGRLKLLVPSDWRWRFEQAEMRFSVASMAKDLASMRVQAESIEKGWAKLDQIAREAGHEPLGPEVWSVNDPHGRRCYLVLNSEHRDAVPETDGYVLTLDEIAKFIPKEISTLKGIFKGTKLEEFEQTEGFADEIPF